MSKNEIVRYAPHVAFDRAREVIRILLVDRGQACQYDLIDGAMLMASDKWRRCHAQLEPWPKRKPKLYSLCEYGYDYLIGSMLVDGLIERDPETLFVRVVGDVEIDAEDRERLEQVKTIKANAAKLLGSS